MSRRPAPATDRSATYRQVFTGHEFRLMLSAHAISLLGDQVLRVALALLVYHDTASPLLTAISYALTFLPWVVGGPLLSGITDRRPRRTILVLGNLGRAAVVALMTLPHVPVAVLLILVALAETLSPPVETARSAVLPELLEGDEYVLAMSLNQAVGQASQIIGFGVGGTLVAVIGARAALGIDVASFVVAAALIWWALREPYQVLRQGPPPSYWRDSREGFRVALGRIAPRQLLLMAWWGAAVLLVPEALAAPFVADVAHRGATATGWLLAAQPIGTILGILVMGRLLRPSQRLRLMRPLAVIAMVPMLGFVFRPGLAGAMLLLIASGMAWSYQVPLQAAFVGVVPAEARGRAFGVAASGLQVSQGLGVLVGGGLAEAFGVTAAITAAGVAGLLGMLRLVVIRTPSPLPEPAT